MQFRKISIITCVYNEENYIHNYYTSIGSILSNLEIDYEILFVNDGSTDNTDKLLRELTVSDSRITVINLSKNFGKEVALTAGLDFSSGDAVMPVDVDLQEPIELIPEFIKQWENGFKNVIGVKKDRIYEPYIKRKSVELFYRVVKKVSNVEIIPNSSDFRLLDRKVVNEIIKIRECNRFMKGIYAIPGFSSTTIQYEVKDAKYRLSKWNLYSLWRLCLDGLFGFSSAAIKIWTYFGFIMIITTVLYSLFLLLKVLLYGVEVPGYVTIIVFISIFGSTLLIAIGIVGEYIARIFEQVKGRPLYVVESILRKYK